MNPQQLIHHRGRRYLVETVTTRTVTELTDRDCGVEVGATLAAEVLEAVDAHDRIPPWPTNGLVEVLIARYETGLFTQADKFVQCALAMAVHELATDGELHEWLDRIGIDLDGGVAA